MNRQVQGNEQDYVIVTQHEKGAVVDPIFSEVLGVRVTELHANTDQLGTFDGEMPRRDGPLATALAKAQIGRDLGVTRVLASEGTFSPHPAMPWMTVNSELIVALVDDLPSPVVGSAVSLETVVFSREVGPDDDLHEIATQAKLAGHAVLVRNIDDEPAVLSKGIQDGDALREALTRVWRVSPSRRAHVHSDLRAHLSGSRRSVIAAAARDLAVRLSQTCPSCHIPGWGATEVIRGAPCTDCGRATNQIRGERLSCPHCLVSESRIDLDLRGDPGACDRCNP